MSSTAATSNGGFRLAAPAVSAASAYVEVPPPAPPAAPAPTPPTGTPGGVIDYTMVTVGDAGNIANPDTGLGAVGHDFRIGTYDVTIKQYTDFLNAVAKNDPYSLYNMNMASDLNTAGIVRSGSSGAYSYSVVDNVGDSGNRPITYVSWFDAARFANWMSNGQPVNLETSEEVSAAINNGAYNLASVPAGVAPGRNDVNPHTGESPTFFLPTQDEWYKAAYFSPHAGSGVPGYFAYATLSNAIPGNQPGSAPNQMTSVISASRSRACIRARRTT
jgi:hypothetical protein